MVYVTCVAIFFTVGLFLPQNEDEEVQSNKGPYWIVSMLCLVLSLMIGYLTRIR